MDAVDGEDAENDVIQRQDARFGSAHGLALILLAAALAIAPFVTQRYGFPGFVAIYFAAVLAWLPLLRLTLPLGVTITLAIVLRAMFLFHDPVLSGDVYRYLSDGRVVAAGGNPYTYYPADPRINHPEIRSIYPPHAQLLFALVHELTPWRLLIIAADVACIFLLRRRGALAFAACPLVIVEGTWSGHIDALAAVLLAFAFARRSSLAAGFAAGLKIIPLAAVPVLFRRRMPAVAFIAALLLPVLPFLGGPIMPGFRDYATRWIFNSPLYDAVFAIVSRIPTKELWTEHPLRFALISDFVYRHVYPDFITRAILGVLALGAIALARRGTTAIAALLLCSPAIHPWYWLTLVPLAFMERSRWLAVAVVMPLSYLLYAGVPNWIVYACSALSALVISRWSPPRGDSPS
jgi:alpha-1,6-mannosyltransferase